MSSDVLLRRARVIRKDGTVEGPCDILVISGIIEAVVPCASGHSVGFSAKPDTLKKSYGAVGSSAGPEGKCGAVSSDYIRKNAKKMGVKILDCDGCFVSPGLVNLHTHTPMTIFRGIAEDVNIEDWFNVKIWPYESRLKPRDVRMGSMLAIYEMLDSGVTGFFDHYFFSQEIAAAAEEAGIRADIAPTIFGLVPDWKKNVEDAVRLIEKVNGKSGRVRMRVGPHAPYTCPPEVLGECVKWSKRLGVGIHIHVSETARQVQDSLEAYGRTPFRILYDAAAMEVPCVFAHGIWIQEDEVGLLNEKCIFAVTPKTYLKLSAGFGNLYRYVTKEDTVVSLNLGIGTDGAASSNTLNPVEQARLFGLSGKLFIQDATQFDLKSVWKMLMKSHEALGQNTGDVAPGYAADLVVWDLSFAHTWPVYDPLAAIIYSADNRNVRDVLIGGEFKKKDGKVLVFNIREVLSCVADIKNRLLSEGKGKALVTY